MARLVGGGWIRGAGADEVVGVGEGCEKVWQLGGLLGVGPHLCQAGAQQLPVEVQERAARRLQPPTHQAYKSFKCCEAKGLAIEGVAKEKGKALIHSAQACHMTVGCQ